MLTSLQAPLSLVGRVLLALLFIPAGFSKIGVRELSVQMPVDHFPLRNAR